MLHAHLFPFKILLRSSPQRVNHLGLKHPFLSLSKDLVKFLLLKNIPILLILGIYTLVILAGYIFEDVCFVLSKSVSDLKVQILVKTKTTGILFNFCTFS